MEANPGTLTPQKLKCYKNAGVNRLSIGLQSADDSLLSRIGRIHNYSDFLINYENARKAGFDNINVDIMYALPGQSLFQHETTLKSVSALSPEHISAYSLILEEGTPLFDEQPSLPDEDESFAMHKLTRDFLRSKGYLRYEISNYAKAGYSCRHNLHYWNSDEYLGLGLNAHSAWKIEKEWTRFANTSDIGKYIGNLERNALPEESRNVIAPKDEMFEYIMLALRKIEGLREDAFYLRFGRGVYEIYSEAIKGLKGLDWLEETPGSLRLNERGMDMQNEALLLFMD